LKLDRDKLQRAREMLGYSIETTAEEAGVSKNSVLRAEHEDDIRPVTARKIAGALGVRVADLLPKAQSPLPLEETLTAAERANIERQKRGEAKPEAFFVPLEEGEEEETVTLHINWVRLMEGDDPVLQAVRLATPEEEAEIRKQLEQARGGPS
jgi:transcriptional regulator with XRE-family HTH domain